MLFVLGVDCRLLAFGIVARVTFGLDLGLFRGLGTGFGLELLDKFLLSPGTYFDK